MLKATRSPPFYTLPRDQRIELVRAAAQGRRTLIERWRALDGAETAPWNERAACAAKMLSEQTAVVDIGCGNMQLELYLPANCTYIPIDVVARDQRTIVVDLNTDHFPDISSPAYAALGLIEYLYDPPRLLDRLRGHLVLNYNPVDYNPDHREEHAWVNHFSVAEFERMLAALGWAQLEVIRLGDQLLWHLQR